MNIWNAVKRLFGVRHKESHHQPPVQATATPAPESRVVRFSGRKHVVPKVDRLRKMNIQGFKGVIHG